MDLRFYVYIEHNLKLSNFDLRFYIKKEYNFTANYTI